MRFALPVISVVLTLLVSMSIDDSALIAIAVVTPNSFVLGYLYDKFKQQEKEDHEQGGSKNEQK